MRCPNFLPGLIFSRPFGIIVNTLRALVNKKPDPRYIVGANPQDTIHKVLIAMDFEGPSFDDLEESEPDGEFVRVYYMENSCGFNMVHVYSDTIFLKMYSNHDAFSDSGVIGPPLPNARDLVQFIYYEGVFEDDDDT